MSKKILIVLYIQFILLSSTICEDIIPISIGEQVKGEFSLDESHRYYSLLIPKNASNHLLIISTHEDSSIKENMKGSFSDPDFYISKTNKYPSSKRTSEWYSEQYGADIMSIPSESVKENDIFYIGMYCQFKCRYFLKIETGRETEIKLNQVYHLKLKKQESMNYKLKITQDFQKLKILTYSFSKTKFKIFMNKNSPSSANSYKVIPFWDSGYAIIIKSGSEEYCSNCEYHIIIYNEGETDNENINNMIIEASTEEKDISKNLNNIYPLFDALEKDSKICFNFNITEKQKRTEKLILDLVVYSGDATLLIEGWKNKDIKSKSEAEKVNYSYKVVMEKHIILDSKDFNAFDKEESYYYGRDSKLNLCLFSGRQLSYRFQAYFLSDFNKIAHISKLSPGYKVRTYLLKDQIMPYELLVDYLSKSKYGIQTNITVVQNLLVGKTSFYGYYCIEEKCNLTNPKDFKKIEYNKDFIKPESYQPEPNTYLLNLPHENNYCLKNPKIKTKNGNIIDCAALTVIRCDKPSEENGMCIFDIQLQVKDTELMMKSKEVYNGMLPLGKVDKYKIIISDENIKDLFIVLNTDSGNAQLAVFLDTNSLDNKETLLSISAHNDYIPDVVRVTPKKIGKENLVGTFIVKVYPETMSKYKVYYYTLYKNDTNNNLPEATMNLKLGQFISDYFPNDIRYKIYTFSPMLNKKSTLKIFINRLNINFDIFVFNDISKFEILQIYHLKQNPNAEHIKGYQWKSNTNNELIIPKDDPNFQINKLLYIVIAPSDPLNFTLGELQEKLISKYFIGIISEDLPFSLTEGMPHIMTLSNSYSQQIYLRVHPDPNKNFDLLISLLLGEIDVFVSTEYFTQEDINDLDLNSAEYNSYTGMYELNNFLFLLNLKSFTTFQVSSQYLKNHLNNKNSELNNNINIYYYIRRSESMVTAKKVCQYIIFEKTSETKGQYLMPGIIQTGNLKPGEKAYFIIEEVAKRTGPFITVNFKNGFGNAYVRIPDIPEKSSQMRFPDEGYYDYKGQSIYSGKLITIPEKEFKKLKNGKLQMLVTISAEFGSYQNNPNSQDSSANINKNLIKFSISYSNEPKRLNQNIPYDGFIAQGDVQYFNLYFDNSTENIYIGLTNMNGDADLYVNKGKELPTYEKYNWVSNKNNHEYVEISKDDEFFKKNNMSIYGYYTLSLVGFIDTSFSLFVSTHKNKVIPLRDNIPMGCWCEKKGDKCYFRYNDVFDKDSIENGLDHNDFVFTTQYLYGSGYMYAKAFLDKEIHNANSEQFYSNFPDSNNHDISNKESNQMNYMKMKISGEKYQKDSLILLTFECNQKTKVDITTTALRHFTSVDYISENRENVYYLGKNHKNDQQANLTLIINNFIGRDKDLIYSVHSYVGDAHFKIYGNSSTWDSKTQKVMFKYKLLNEFDIITNDQDQDTNIEIYNPLSHDYHNFLDKEDKQDYDDIYIYVQPINEFGFFISYNYDKNWNNVPIGKTQTFFVVNQEFNGYFDINDEYTDVEFSLWVQNNLRMFADVYIKINTIDKFSLTPIMKNQKKKDDQFSIYHYSYPSVNNYDYHSISDKTIGKISININRLPKLTEDEIKTGKKFVRVLFYVRLGQTNFETIEENTNQENNNEEMKEEQNDLDETKTMINIAITPGIDYFKYVELKPFEYYYSNLVYGSRRKLVENKIYALHVENINHDVLVIEISTCLGYYEINIQQEMITKENLNKPSLPYEQFNDKGKRIIYIENIQSKHYYLNVRSKKFRTYFGIDRDKNERGNNLQYLIYYYTTYSDSLDFQDIDKWITHRPHGRGEIQLDLPLIITNDIEANKKQISDYKFDVFATKNKGYTSNMGSICYLSRLTPREDRVFKIESMAVENKTSLILKNLIPGNRYYINVLAQNLKTKELIAFHPIEVYAGGVHPHYKNFFRIILMLGLIIGLIYFAYKYKTTKDELVFLKGDAYPKTENEIRNMGYESPNVKYTGLGSNY